MTIAAAIFVSLLTTAVGQSVSAPPTPPPNPDALPVSLAHIRKALDESTADAPKLRVASASSDSLVRTYVRPPTPFYDFEYKQMTTPDPVKGCGRLTSGECLQSYVNQFLTGLLWQQATQRKKATQP